ncbi:MAG: hypothetical protein HC868_05285 [Sphingomonadales bacterium]|nr:hypothetical protein [Sphingomonadales bacterium]
MVLTTALTPVALAQTGPQPVASGLHRTQIPSPFGADPGPQVPGRAQCTPDDRKRRTMQIQAYEKLQSLSRNEADQLCSLLESTEDLGKLADGRVLEKMLPVELRDLLKALGVDFAKTDMKAVLKILGVDLDNLDLRKVKAQCRQTQGEADRMFTSEIGRLKRELLLCDDTI